MRTLPTLLLSLGLLVPLSALAQQPPASVKAVERVSERVPAEVEAFKAVKERFEARSVELEADAKRFLATRKAEALDKVSGGYDNLIQSLAEAEHNQRLLAIARLEDFLQRYPSSSESDNVRFRLAELYYEVGVEQWLMAQASLSDLEDEYDRQVEAALESGDEAALDAIGDPPESSKKDFKKPIQLYLEIILNSEGVPRDEQWEHVDRAYYTLGYSYRDTEVVQHDYDLAKDAFASLIVRYPDSPLADAAHMFLGNLEFNEDKDFPEAIRQYNAVIDRGPDGPYYQEASFQLAWTYYKLASLDSEYEQGALELFTSILDESEESFMQSGRESDYAPDARLNMARTLADMAFKQDRSPVELVDEYFLSIRDQTYPDGRPWERDTYLALAEVLAGCVPVPDSCPPGRGQGGRNEYDYAIDVYDRLQTEPRWITEPDNPTYQMKLIHLLPGRIDPVEGEVSASRKLLVDRYSEMVRDPYTGDQVSNPWWEANRNNPDALDQVRRFIEASLSSVAMAMFVDAQEQKDPAMYRAAADKYRDYLNKFPIADNFFVLQWFMANALLNSMPVDPSRPWGPYEEATEEFQSLVRSHRHHEFGDGALLSLVQAKQLIVESKRAPLDQVPSDAEVVEVRTTKWMKQLTVYRLSDEHTALIGSIDDVLAHEFEPPKEAEAEAEAVDYAELAQTNQAFYLYVPGQVLYLHGHYEPARERFIQVYKQAPGTDEAGMAANNIVGSYINEGDMMSAKTWTIRFCALAEEGVVPMDPQERLEFCGKESKFEFVRCINYVGDGDRASAAECFEDYLVAYPDKTDEDYCLAEYNAANSYDEIGQADKANTLFEAYVADCPDAENTDGIRVRIAQNYEAIFELDKAVSYYRQIIKSDPKREGEYTNDAQFNAAFLEVGRGNYRSAARGFEEYARVFPEAEDNETTFFLAGEQWEKVSKTEALRFYNRYLSKYGDTNPDHVMEAMYRIASIYKDQRKTTAATRQMDAVVEQFNRYADAGVELSPTSRRYAAERGFEILQAAYDDYRTGEITGNEDKDTALLEEKSAAVEVFEDEALAFMSRYKELEYGLGAFYLTASAYLFVAELGFSMDCPDRYSEDDCEVWYEIYDEDMVPAFEEFQNTAIKRYKNLITRATNQKRQFVWVDKAYEDLNRLDPFNYPDIKVEKTAEPDYRAYPDVPPVSAKPPEPVVDDGGAQ